jgi:hypothetical protein
MLASKSSPIKNSHQTQPHSQLTALELSVKGPANGTVGIYLPLWQPTPLDPKPSTLNHSTAAQPPNQSFSTAMPVNPAL